MLSFEDLHELPEINEANEKKHTCPSCGGDGKWLGGKTNNHGNNKCIRCSGRGFLLTDPKELDRRKVAKKQNHDKKVQAFFAKNKELLTWAVSNSGWNNFAESLIEQLYKKAELSDRQLEALARMKDKTEATQAEKAKKREANIVTVDLTKLHAMFDQAKQNGLKKPALTIGDVRVSLAPLTGTNAGHLYVKQYGNYQGKITPEGKFLTVRNADESIKPKLITICEDPTGQIRSIGRDTGVCCCCGRALTNQTSIDAGIGPICADKWNL